MIPVRETLMIQAGVGIQIPEEAGQAVEVPVVAGGIVAAVDGILVAIAEVGTVGAAITAAEIAEAGRERIYAD